MEQKKIFDMIKVGEISALESDLEIEDCILYVKGIDNKIDFLKRLKKKRTQSISDELSRLEELKTIVKDIIEKTLEEFDHKSLNFPSVGRVRRSKKSGSWNVKDEDALLEELRENLDDDEFNAIVKTKLSISKKELNKYLDSIPNDKLPKNVEKAKDGTVLSISFDKEAKADDIDDIDVGGSNVAEASIDNYDGIGEF